MIQKPNPLKELSSMTIAVLIRTGGSASSCGGDMVEPATSQFQLRLWPVNN